MFTLAALCNCWMGDINSLAAASVSGLRRPPPAEYEEELVYSVTPHLTGIWNLLYYALPTINLVLFEKPALDSRKLASQKGNNLILSNLAEGEKYCNPFHALWLHVKCMCLLSVCASLCSFTDVVLCIRICFHPTQRFFEHVILLLGPLCEIVDIAFSVDVPIGFSHIANNNRRVIWSWKSIAHTYTLTYFCSVHKGPIGAPL